jgi:hypothetical protein
VDNGEPRWDDERARSLVGKYALVGLTFLDAEGNLLSQAQRHGRVVEVDEERGISIRFVAHGRSWDGEVYRLPPDLRPVTDAAPGEYRLRSTGEVIVDPDVTITWTITNPPADDDSAEKQHAREAEDERLGFEPRHS